MRLEYIKELYRKGLSLRRISSELGLPRETLRLTLLKEGFKLRKSRKDLAIKYHEPQTDVSPRSAELIAMHAGDGSLSVNGTWCLSSYFGDRKLISRVCSLTRSVLGIEPRVYRRENKVEIVSGQNQVYIYFSEIFPVGKKSHIVQLPNKFYLTDNHKIIRSMLVGLFSTDGSFSSRKTGAARVEFRVRSECLRNQFLILSARIGFKFNDSNPMSKGRPIYTAYIEDRKKVKRWMETIGSRCDTHNERYERWLQAGVP